MPIRGVSNRLKAGLREGHSVTRSLYDAGYGSSSRLYERASSQLGMTPSRYRKQGSGVTIRYSIAETPVGRLLLAATERGICSIQFGDSDSCARRRAPKRISAGGNRAHRQSSSLVGFEPFAIGSAARTRRRCRWTSEPRRSSAWCGKQLRADSERRHAILQRNCQAHRTAASRPSRRARLRYQSGRGRDPVPSRGSGRRCAWEAIAGESSASRSSSPWKRKAQFPNPAETSRTPSFAPSAGAM